MENLKEIQTLRETKGKEQETLELISQAMEDSTGDVKTTVTLNWEAALVYQHIVMNEIAKPEPEQNQQTISDAGQKMAEHAQIAHKLVVDNNLDMLSTSYRFLGRVADYSEKYEEAAKHYIKGLELLPPDHHQRLELSAHLGCSKIMTGQVDEGKMISRKTYDSFFNTEMGKNLKENDYYVWAVWMSGVAPRTLTALQKVGADYGREEMKKWLEESKNELENPTGKVTWGDNKFQFRIDELNKALLSL